MIPFILLIIACATALPVLVLTAEICAAAFLPDRISRGTSTDLPADCQTVILVPAHNEATGIQHVLQNIQAEMSNNMQLLVVADNCTDSTAKIARQTGAQVIERFNKDLRGKGYALDHGIRHLAAQPPDIIIIIDADCEIGPGSLEQLTRTCLNRHRPVQATYLMRSPPGAGIGLRVAEFAWLLKNSIRPLGLARFDLPCQLTGTGMAFPWSLLVESRLASGELVEDMQLGIDLAEAGTPPVFESRASVFSTFPDQKAAQETQRTRWEHGHLGMISSRFPRLLLTGLRKMNIDTLSMALDLAVPPLALLTSVQLADLILNVTAVLAGWSSLPLIINVTAMALLFASILISQHKWGQHILPLSSLLYVPVYILKRIPRHFRFLTHREKNWIRTNRERDQ